MLIYINQTIYNEAMRLFSSEIFTKNLLIGFDRLFFFTETSHRTDKNKRTERVKSEMMTRGYCGDRVVFAAIVRYCNMATEVRSLSTKLAASLEIVDLPKVARCIGDCVPLQVLLPGHCCCQATVEGRSRRAVSNPGNLLSLLTLQARCSIPQIL